MLIVLAVSVSGCITFDTVPGAGNPSLSDLETEGFSFRAGLGHFRVIGQPTLCSFGGCVDNGTVYIARDPEGGSNPSTSIGMSSTALFFAVLKELSFDCSPLFLDDAAAAAGGSPNAEVIEVRVISICGPLCDRTTQHTISNDGFRRIVYTLPPDTFGVLGVSFIGKTASGAPGAFALDNILIITAPPLEL
jgi:hypothetical protein